MPRLINLALALAALANLALIPVEWMVVPLFFKDLLSLVIINLLVPSAIILMVLCKAGLHRKDQTAMPPFPIGVMLGWLAYFGLWILVVGIAHSKTALIFLIFAIILVPLACILFFLVMLPNAIAAISTEFANFTQATMVPGGAAVPFPHVAGVSLALVVISALILWFSPIPALIKESMIRHERFEAACRDVGIQFYKKPDASVRSIAYDTESAIAYRRPVRYELDPKGRIRSYAWEKNMTGARAPDLSNLDFIERRPAPGIKELPMGDKHAFIRYPAKGQPYGIDAATADVLVMRRDTGSEIGMQTALTITARRNGELLARMTYVADLKNSIACGANRHGAIDEEAFVSDALAQ